MPFPVYVFDHVLLVGERNLFSPSQGVLIGLSPVYMKTSYRNPPKVHPQNGATIGTCVTEVSKCKNLANRRREERTQK
jgi:hypothetical protein